MVGFRKKPQGLDITITEVSRERSSRFRLLSKTLGKLSFLLPACLFALLIYTLLSKAFFLDPVNARCLLAQFFIMLGFLCATINRPLARYTSVLAAVIGAVASNLLPSAITAGLAETLFDILKSVTYIIELLRFPESSGPEPQNLAVVLVSILTVISILAYKRGNSAILLALLSAAFFFKNLLTSGPTNKFIFFLALALIGFSFFMFRDTFRRRREIVQMPSVLPIILVISIVLGMFYLLPEFSLQNQRLYDSLEFIRERLKREERLPDTINYYEFSIKDLGYYPSGDNLGGPINIIEKAYMRYDGPSEASYLRGSIYDFYQNSRWSPTSMDPNYVFRNDDPGFQQRKSFYLSDRHYPEDKRIALNREETASIWPLEQPVQTIFNPGRLSSIEEIKTNQDSDSLLRFFFNEQGQVYASHILPETGYRISAYYPKKSEPSFSEDVIKLVPENLNLDPKSDYQAIIQKYDPGLAKLVYSHEGSDRDRLIRLYLVKKYLSENYIYNLKVATVPANVDFFENFLNTKEGYCTYFATAMTIAAQEMGFKAYYVEGFLVPGVTGQALGRYERIVKNTSAHAWTEVVLPEIGGVIIDAVPNDALSNLSQDKDRESSPPPTEPSTPEPSQSETAESQTDPSEPEEEPQNDDQEAGTVSQKPFLLLFFILLLALILAILTLRKLSFSKRRYNYDYLSRKYSNAKIIDMAFENLKELYEYASDQKLAEHLTVLGIFREYSRAFSKLRPELRREAFNILERAFYSGTEATAKEVSQVLEYGKLVEEEVKLNSRSKLKYFKTRVLQSKKV